MENNQSSLIDLDLMTQGIFFTPVMGIINIVFLVLALVYSQIEMTVFLLIILFISLGLRFWSRISTRKLTYQVTLDKGKVFPQESVDFLVKVENRKWLPILVKFRIALHPSLVTEGEKVEIQANTNILWYQSFSFSRQLVPQKRGVYKTSSSRLITGDFFGIFPNQTRDRQSVELLVYPKLISLKPFPLLKRIMFGKTAIQSPVHDPIYILGTQDYQKTSPARNIHWKASARLHKLQEKIFESAEQEKIVILLDAEGFSVEAEDAVFETAVEIVAALAIELDQEHYSVGFLTNCQTVRPGPVHLPPKRSATQIPNLLETLARLSKQMQQPMNRLTGQRFYLPKGGSCIYLSSRPIDEENQVFRQKIPTVNIIPDISSRESESPAFRPVTKCYQFNQIIADR